MTYATGTITNANPGPTLYAAMEPTLLDAGFTVEDTVTIGSRTHKVLKSDASVNSLGLTWFLDVSFPTTGTSGGMYMSPFEDFDADTDLGYRGPYTNSSTTIDGTTYSRYGATGQALETQWVNFASWTDIDIALSTSVTGWFLSATTDRVILNTTSSPGELHYVGFFDPTADHIAHAGEALYPLVVVHFATASDVPQATSTTTQCSMAFTRVPKITSMNWSASGTIGLPIEQLGGAVGSGGHSSTGKVNLVRRPVIMGHSTVGNPAAALVGYLMDVVNTLTDGSVVRGDELTDDNSDTWIATDDSSTTGLWFKAV